MATTVTSEEQVSLDDVFNFAAYRSSLEACRVEQDAYDAYDRLHRHFWPAWVRNLFRNR